VRICSAATFSWSSLSKMHWICRALLPCPPLLFHSLTTCYTRALTTEMESVASAKVDEEQCRLAIRQDITCARTSTASDTHMHHGHHAAWQLGLCRPDGSQTEQARFQPGLGLPGTPHCA